MRVLYLNGAQEGFDIFWKAFPKKRNKGHAEKSWAKLKPDDLLLGLMLAKIEQAKQTPDWRNENGRYIPCPASWPTQSLGRRSIPRGMMSRAPTRDLCLEGHHTADRKSKPCGKAIAPDQHGPVRPFCDEHLAERQRVDAQLAIAEGQA